MKSPHVYSVVGKWQTSCIWWVMMLSRTVTEWFDGCDKAQLRKKRIHQLLASSKAGIGAALLLCCSQSMGCFHRPSSLCCNMRGKQHHLLTMSIKETTRPHVKLFSWSYHTLWSEGRSQKWHTGTDLKASSLLSDLGRTTKCSSGCLRRKTSMTLIGCEHSNQPNKVNPLVQ